MCNFDAVALQYSLIFCGIADFFVPLQTIWKKTMQTIRNIYHRWGGLCIIVALISVAVPVQANEPDAEADAATETRAWAEAEAYAAVAGPRLHKDAPVPSPLLAHCLSLNELQDSLNTYYNPFLLWSAPIRVKQLRTNGNTIVLRTNTTLSGVPFSPDELKSLRRQVSLWVLGNTQGKVTLYTGSYELSELLPDRMQTRKEKYPSGHSAPAFLRKSVPSGEVYTHGLDGKIIALWSSHGIFYNHKQDEWKWQRATLWTTVEDLYSVEYGRRVTEMLENAGAIVLQPRARYEGLNLRRDTAGQWTMVADGAGLETGASGFPRWAEAARYWLEYAGYPSALWDINNHKNDYKDDLQSRGLWVNYLTGGSKNNPSQEGLGIPVDVAIALHTDGYDSPNDTTTVGTLAIYTDHDDTGRRVFANGKTRQINRDLADYVQTQIVADIRQTYTPNWTRRQLHNANYCESRYPIVPSVLIEILSHKSMVDMRYGLDPEFRNTVARAIYKGLVRYLHSTDGRKVIIQPLPVRACAVEAERDTLLRLSWQPQNDPLEPTAIPTHYYVYTRADGGEWQSVKVSKPSHTFVAQRGKRYDFYIIAANGGGRSLRSEVLSAYLSPDRNAPTALIVNAFHHTYAPEWFADSLHAGIVPHSYAVEDGQSLAYIGEQYDWNRCNKWANDDNCGWGMCYRDHQATVTVGNTHDYPVLHGKALQAMGISYLSASSEAVCRIDSAYTFVDIIAGQERPTDSTSVLSDTLLQALSAYLQQGGRLLLSGSRIGSGLDARWTATHMGYTYYTSRATRSGVIQVDDTLVCTLRTEPNTDGLFSESPESLQPSKGAVRLARYQDMHTPAGIMGNFPNHSRTISFGFPLEALTDFNALYTYSIQQLLQDPYTQQIPITE